MIFYEEYRARRTGPGRHRRRGPARPDDRALRLRRAAKRGAARHPPRHRDLVPGLLRARRGLRPRQRQDPRRARRRRMGDHRPEGVDLARALGAVDLRARAHQPRRAEAQGPLLSPRADGAARHRDPARSCSSPATRSSTRRSSTARARPPRTWWVRSTTAGGSRWARSRSSGAPRRSVSSSAFEQELRTITELGARERRRHRSGAAAATGRRVDHAARDALPRAAHACPRSSTARSRPPPRSTSCSGRASTARSASSRSTCAGPAGSRAATKHCKACSSTAAPTPSTAARTRSNATSSENGRWDCRRSRSDERARPRVPARPGPARRQDRARDRGRGHRASASRPPSAAPRKAARVAITDIHERRLRESAEELGAHAVLANVSSQDDVRSLLRRSVIGAFGHLDVLVNNAGLGGTARLADMTDDQWFSVLDVTLTGTMRMTRRRARHMSRRGSGRDREQRVGGRLARAGGPVALRGREGRRDGAHPVRGDRSRGARRAHRTRSRRHWRCTRTSPRSPPTSSSPSSRRSEAFGRAAEPWEVANVIVFLASDLASYMTGEIISVSSQHP